MKNLREIERKIKRNAKRTTPTYIAISLGMSPTRLSNILRGKVKVDKVLVDKIFKAVNRVHIPSLQFEANRTARYKYYVEKLEAENEALRAELSQIKNSKN